MAPHRRASIAALVFASAALVGILLGGAGLSVVPSSSAAVLGDITRQARQLAPNQARRSGARPRPDKTALPPPPARRGGDANGAGGRGRTVVDTKRPAVANLDRELLAAFHGAAAAAAAAGVEIFVNSGWRSPEYQKQLFRAAVLKYGSERQAARWVAAPTTSSHVLGQAVDIGPARAMAWLSRHGARYGLCQIYRNEPWHFELRPQAINDGCPPMYADPTHDPRMRD